MNNELDPYVSRMRDAEGDAARASILLAAPVFTLMRLRREFTALCRSAAFDDGVDYIDALAQTLSEPRHIGVLANARHQAMRIRLLHVAEGGET